MPAGFLRQGESSRPASWVQLGYRHIPNPDAENAAMDLFKIQKTNFLKIKRLLNSPIDRCRIGTVATA